MPRLRSHLRADAHAAAGAAAGLRRSQHPRWLNERTRAGRPGRSGKATASRPLSRWALLGSMQPMAIRLENVGIAVRDLEATIAFFTDLGLRSSVVTRSAVSGPTPPSALTATTPRSRCSRRQTVTVASSSSSTSTPRRSSRSPLVPTRSACTASRSLSTTSMKPSRSPQDTDAIRSAAWRRIGRLQAHVRPRSERHPRDARRGTEEGLTEGRHERTP